MPDGPTTGVFDLVGLDEPAADDHARVIAGRYEIIESIGSGATGQVMLVRHRRLGKPFALKLMQASHTLDPEVREVFHREARLASSLSHRNIVSVIDFGEDPDWGVFIVMEYVDGEALLDRIKVKGPLPISVVCDVATQLASALEHSHENRVVHGDLKPENILCTITGVGPRLRKWNVKLVDFGLAKLASATGERQEQVSGTPEYMAPERISGELPHASNDIYALGVILYEMLTGTVPFSSGDPLALLRMHLSDEPPSIEERRGEIVDQALLTIVARAMEKDPANRYATAGELGRDLRIFMDALGMAQRSEPRHSTFSEDDAIEARVSAAAFHALGVPAAGLFVDGTIAVANQRFARLIGKDSHQELQGAQVLSTNLAQVHPALREDIRLVAMHGKMARRRLTYRRRGGETTTFRLICTPADGSCGHCVIVLHTIPNK